MRVRNKLHVKMNLIMSANYFMHSGLDKGLGELIS